MPRLVRTRLSAMMFLFFLGVGAWFVTLPTYLLAAPAAGGLAFTTAQVGWVYSTFAVGGVLAPLVTGLLADRLFRAERVLGVSSLAAAGFLAAAGWWCDASAPGCGPAARAAADTFRPLFGLMLGYCFAVQLGMTLVAVITLRNLPDGGRGFGRVRLVGTVGWIAAGNLVGVFLAPVSAGPLYLGAAAAAALGGYAFTLPATPPAADRAAGGAGGVPVLELFQDRSFGVFVGVAFLSTAMNQFYTLYSHPYLTALDLPKPEQLLTLGQVCEVGCMLVIPALNPRRHLKTLMAVGLAGWVVRAAVLTWGYVPAVVAVGVPMHGWSYAFFYVVAATYLDRQAPPGLRASVQAVLTFASGGLGVWAGNLLAGAVVDAHRVGAAIDWPAVWRVPLVGSGVALVAFVALFRAPDDTRRM